MIKNATDFLRECRKDKAFKNAVDPIDNKHIIDFAEAYADLRLSKVDLATLDDINGVEIVSPHGRSYVGWTFVNEKEVILKNNNRTLRVTAQAHSES